MEFRTRVLTYLGQMYNMDLHKAALEHCTEDIKAEMLAHLMDLYDVAGEGDIWMAEALMQDIRDRYVVPMLQAPNDAENVVEFLHLLYLTDATGLSRYRCVEGLLRYAEERYTDTGDTHYLLMKKAYTALRAPDALREDVNIYDLEPSNRPGFFDARNGRYGTYYNVEYGGYILCRHTDGYVMRGPCPDQIAFGIPAGMVMEAECRALDVRQAIAQSDEAIGEQLQWLVS